MLSDLVLTSSERTIVFCTPAELMDIVPGLPVIVPAVDESQVRLVEELRERHCLVPILAVVIDLDGHQTSRAMTGGASCVLNLELPPARRGSVLRTVLDEWPRGDVPEPGGPGVGASDLRTADLDAPAVPGTVAAPRVAEDPAPVRDALCEELSGIERPEDVHLLVDLLCGSQTIAAIARQFFCSERSMYRRVRRLYETAGVGSRAQLRMQLAVAPDGSDRRTSHRTA